MARTSTGSSSLFGIIAIAEVDCGEALCANVVESTTFFLRADISIRCGHVRVATYIRNFAAQRRGTRNVSAGSRFPTKISEEPFQYMRRSVCANGSGA